MRVVEYTIFSGEHRFVGQTMVEANGEWGIFDVQGY